MKNRAKLATMLSIIVSTTLLSACAQTDVVGKTAKTSFSDLLKKAPETLLVETEQSWSFVAPDAGATFFWNKEFNNHEGYEAWMEVDATPFIEAGLDASKLPEGILVNNELVFGIQIEQEEQKQVEKASPEQSFATIVDLEREKIGYHEVLDHYGIDLSGGNKFEWAKDTGKNDKDIVFVVDPQILIDAGVSPEKIEGWTYATVEMLDDRGKKIEVQKLLKAFDL